MLLRFELNSTTTVITNLVKFVATLLILADASTIRAEQLDSKAIHERYRNSIFKVYVYPLLSKLARVDPGQS